MSASASTEPGATKHCGRCGRDKPVGDFHRRKNGRQAWCKTCRKEYAAAYYQLNKAARQKVHRRRHLWFSDWYTGLKKGKPCIDCGMSFHPAAMHWDHLPGAEKRAALATLRNHGSKEGVLAEIQKCELVCANCHAVRTFERRRAVLEVE